MPRFCRFLCGPRVTVSPHVMSGPASPGQHVCTGKRARSTSAPSHTTSWHGPDERSFGAMSSTFMNTGRVFCHASLSPFGGSGSFRNASSFPMSRSAVRQSSPSTPIARATRCGVPNRLPSTGIALPPGERRFPLGLLEQQRRTAGLQHAIAHFRHFELRDRPASATRLNSPRASSWAMKSRRSR